MPLQNFVAKVGPAISAAWLNQVDALKFTIFGDAATPAQARANLTSDAPLEVGNGGTGTRGSGASFLAFLASFFPSLYQYINPLTPGEIAANVTPVDFSYQPTAAGVDACRYGYNADNGVTDNTVAVQNAFNANAGFFRVIIPGGGYGKMTARVTAPANLHMVLAAGAELRWSATTANGTNWLGAASRPGIEALGFIVIEGRGKITGPSIASYVFGEMGVYRIGASAVSRGSGFVVRDVEITQWGYAGIATQFVQDIDNSDCLVHDNGYAGIMHLSGLKGRVKRNRIYNITPGASGNMYGVSCTHNSANYNIDPNRISAPRQTVNPFCIDFDVSENLVYGINWIGLDAHGLYDSNYHDNKVYDCYIGIQVASSSGDAIDYAGENNKVNSNTVIAKKIDGSASSTSGHSSLQYGITLNGGAVLSHRGVECIGNTIVGCGDTSGAGGLAFSIQHSLMQDSVITGNSIRDWYSIGTYGTVFDGTISNNVFNAPANVTLSKVIWVDSNSNRCTINGNRLELHGGSAPAEGIRFSSTGSQRPVIGSNNMSQATTPYSGDAVNFTAGLSDIVPQLPDATLGSHTLDVGPLGFAPRIHVQANQSGVATLTSLLNPQMIGQEVTIFMGGSSTLTVNDSGNIRLQGGTIAMTSSSTLTLVCTSLTTPSWQEKSRTIGNT